MNANDLIAFEDEMAARFNAGEIKSPLHLAGGNEDALIKIFKNVKRDDWILCGWRSHYHALLKGMPPAVLRAKILEGRSIAICSRDYKILSSAIVGGICPIAVGLAWSIKQRKSAERVWCFIGDMTRRAGIVQESIEYTHGHGLPVTWVIEDNGVSVCTDTKAAWGDCVDSWPTTDIMSYEYKLTRPHVGTGKFVSF
jgi:TPP-dependent pyruvate/acetoin dehydrogenase alpha subunit